MYIVSTFYIFSLSYLCPLVAGLVLLERGDGARGWVPASCVRELPSDHMRARHFKQRYQFLKALAELDMAPSEP